MTHARGWPSTFVNRSVCLTLPPLTVAPEGRTRRSGVEIPRRRFSSASRALLGATKTTPARAGGGTTPMTDPTETATKEPTIVTVFEHHDADGADLNVALVRPRKWHF